MGGARALTGAMGASQAAPGGVAPGDIGTRPSLDEAIAKLEKRGGPFMNVLLKKLRAQQQQGTPPATNLGGTTSRVGTTGTPGQSAPALGSTRTAFMGGY
jgi:hypothetical protein